MRSSLLFIASISLAALVCSAGIEPPATLDTKNDVCAGCRMAVSDARFAGQLVAPGEEPKFFDDIGCLARFVSGKGPHRSGAVAYVADHRTKEWVAAAKALYSRCPSLATPMSSHVIAHVDAASRDADKDAAGCAAVTVSELFKGAAVPEGK